MQCCWPDENKYSENVEAIRRNVEDFMWKVRNIDSIENQEKYCLALFKKLGAISSIEEMANTSIDMIAALQKIKLKKESEEDEIEDKMEDSLFIELFKVDDTETKEVIE